MVSVEFAAMVTVPPVVSSEIDWAEAFVSTVTFTPGPIKTTSLFSGTVPVSHMLASPQLPLLVAVIAAPRPTEGNSKMDGMVNSAQIWDLFMLFVLGCQVKLYSSKCAWNQVESVNL